MHVHTFFSRNLSVLCLFGAALVLAGCATGSSSGREYSAKQSRQPLTVVEAVVQSVSAVVIAPEDNETGGGQVAGGLVGAIVGSGAGDRGGRNSQAGAVLGGVLGSLAGTKAQKAFQRKEGLQIIVRLEGAELLAVTQDTDVPFAAGELVYVLRGNGETRVSKR
jgi:outer membrane lipoprotein SlyB